MDEAENSNCQPFSLRFPLLSDSSAQKRNRKQNETRRYEFKDTAKSALTVSLSALSISFSLTHTHEHSWLSERERESAGELGKVGDERDSK